ncbi:keratin-associated protein 6-1-like [Mirounga leonina]|uniref:keratin-associated protein 6-1-like n=1 Tax=Mirounga leonina TaxID=9715 RepID=UPI00156C2991|nr:keratin-associated protein 6-1-like [Mirounga leonina]
MTARVIVTAVATAKRTIALAPIAAAVLDHGVREDGAEEEDTSLSLNITIFIRCTTISKTSTTNTMCGSYYYGGSGYGGCSYGGCGYGGQGCGYGSSYGCGFRKLGCGYGYGSGCGYGYGSRSLCGSGCGSGFGCY